MERDLEFILQSQPKAPLALHVHPYIEAFLKHGWPSRRMNWFFKYKKWIRIVSQSDYTLNEYRFLAGDDEIRLGSK